MALYDPSDTVDVLHPGTGQILTLPTAVAQQAGVTPDMIVPRQQQVGEYTLPIGVAAKSLPPIPPPPPPPPPQQIGRKGGSSSPIQRIGATATAPSDEAAQAVAQPPIAPADGGATSPQAPDAVSGGAQPVGMQAPTPAPTAAPPVTTDDLRQGGEASVLNEQSAAIDKAKEAGTKLADAEAAQHDAAAQAYADQQTRNDQIAADRAKAAQENLNRINQKAAQIDASIDAYSKMKIDRSMDHPIMGAIGLALGAIGQGMIRGDKNPAMDALMQSINRKVQAQVQDREAAANAIGMQKGQLSTLQQQFTDQNAYYDGLKAAEIQRTQNMIQQIAEKSQSPIVKANAMKLNAELDKQKADARGSAIDKQVSRDNADRAFKEQVREHNQSVGLQYAGLNQSERHFQAQQAQAQQFHLDEMAEHTLDRGLAAGQAATAKQQKVNEDVQDRGVQMPVGSVQIKRPDGTVDIQPHYEPLKQENGEPYLLPKERAKDLGDQLTATQSAIQIADKLRKQRVEGGGHLVNNEDALKNTQEYARLLLALHESGGIKRLSGEAVDLFKDVASGGRSPNSLRAVQASLDNMRGDLVDQYNNLLPNYTGPRVKFPDPLELEGAAKLPVQETVKAAIQFNPKRPLSSEAKEIEDAGGTPLYVDSSQIPPSYKSAIDAMGDAIRNPKATPEVKNLARKNLKTIMSGADAGSMRAYAYHALKSAEIDEDK